jgi:bifunctional DNase/RNase
MIPVKVQKITYYHPNRSYAVILKELDGDRRLPVLIGAFEAQSIAMAMESMETPRPLTHDLISNLIKGINANLSSVKIIELKDGVFYSVLDIQSKKIGHREIDSRPSDALALALRMHAPIFVSTDIMDEAIILEKDLQNIEDEIKQEPMIETLEKQLQKAIHEEEYEVAARIRDKIKNI